MVDKTKPALVSEAERFAIRREQGAGFLERLYENSTELLQRQGFSMIATFKPHEIPSWETIADSHGDGVSLTMSLQKGVIFRHGQDLFGFALGEIEGDSKRFRQAGLILQFGVRSISDSFWKEGMTTQEDLDFVLQNITSAQKGHFDKGEVAIVERNGQIDLKRWWNGATRDRGLRNWPQERLSSEEGFWESLELIKDTLTRKFPLEF